MENFQKTLVFQSFGIHFQGRKSVPNFSVSELKPLTSFSRFLSSFSFIFSNFNRNCLENWLLPTKFQNKIFVVEKNRQIKRQGPMFKLPKELIPTFFAYRLISWVSFLRSSISDCHFSFVKVSLLVFQFYDVKIFLIKLSTVVLKERILIKFRLNLCVRCLRGIKES